MVLGKTPDSKNRERIRVPRLAALKQMALTVNLSKNLEQQVYNSCYSLQGNKKRPSFERLMSSLVRFHQPKSVSLRPFWLRVNSIFQRFEKFFTDTFAANK